MRKVLILITVLCLLLVGCATSKEEDYDGDFFDKFVIVNKYQNFEDGWLYETYEKQTKVMYYIWRTSYRGGICPIYNTDGTVKIYTG